MQIPEWLATQIDRKIYNKGCESDIEDEVAKIHVDIELKRCSKEKTSPNIEAMSILQLSTPRSEQQPRHFYMNCQLHNG